MANNIKMTIITTSQVSLSAMFHLHLVHVDSTDIVDDKLALKALFSNVSTSKNLSFMSLHAVSVFCKGQT